MIDPEIEAGIWSQITGLPVTAVHHHPPVWDSEDGSISWMAVYTKRTGGEYIPTTTRVELELDD